MNRYSKRKKEDAHDLDDFFKRYNSRREPEFVKNFFGQEEIEELIGSCGLETPDEYDIEIEYPINVADSYQRGDLVILEKDESGEIESVFYVEVASKSNGGSWDQKHMEQVILKEDALKRKYLGSTIYSFCVSFTDFEPVFLDYITPFENRYAVVLKFYDSGYDVEPYGFSIKSEKSPSGKKYSTKSPVMNVYINGLLVDAKSSREAYFNSLQKILEIEGFEAVHGIMGDKKLTDKTFIKEKYRGKPGEVNGVYICTHFGVQAYKKILSDLSRGLVKNGSSTKIEIL